MGHLLRDHVPGLWINTDLQDDVRSSPGDASPSATPRASACYCLSIECDDGCGARSVAFECESLDEARREHALAVAYLAMRAARMTQ